MIVWWHQTALFTVVSTYRVVVLGNPGGGKSTLARKLCYDLATHDSKPLPGERKQITPILVVLRDYGTEKKVRNCSILQFIEAKANANYQIQPPPDAFEYLLLNGRAMVIFDGLDELLDTSYRQEISSDPDLTPEEKRLKIKNFLNESQFVPDLRSNPLMLALICNIYRGENYIPKNRPELYEKCATMLFERWDKSRGIAIPLPFEAHINPAMKYLAYWIYSDDGLRGGVTERRLIEKATDYLCLRRFDDRDEAENAAREFIEFCRGRAWVFTDTGTTKDGERLYQFTHQTFLEYFTAAYLVRTNSTSDSLITILLPRIAKREWDVVAQLAIQLQSKNLEEAADELLALLIKKTLEFEQGSRWNILSFAARCLGFLVPSPHITREVTMACLAYDLTNDYEKKMLSDTILKNFHAQKGSEPLLNDLLLFATAENRVFIASAIEKQVLDIVSKGDMSLSIKALSAGLNLYLIPLLNLQTRIKKTDVFWRDISNHIFEGCVTIHTVHSKLSGDQRTGNQCKQDADGLQARHLFSEDESG